MLDGMTMSTLTKTYMLFFSFYSGINIKFADIIFYKSIKQQIYDNTQ